MMETSDDAILKNRQEDVNFCEQDEGRMTDESSQEIIQASEEGKEIERSKGGEEADKIIATFLHGKGLSENLIKTLINTDLTDEYIRLFKALDFNDNDIEDLQDLWRIKIEAGRNDSTDSIASDDSSSSATYLSQDSLYLKKVLSKPLIEALREILAKKPADPVEYLGHWLLHFKVCEERNLWRKEEELELFIKREKLKMKIFKDKEPTIPIARSEEEYGEDWNYRDYGEF